MEPSERLPAVSQHAVLPSTTLVEDSSIADNLPVARRSPRRRVRSWLWPGAAAGMLLLLVVTVQMAAGIIRPSYDDADSAPLPPALRQMTAVLAAPLAAGDSAAITARDAHTVSDSVGVEPDPDPLMAPIWMPEEALLERRPQDPPEVPTDLPVRVFVVTVRAKVTAYTAYDHQYTHPQWADGIVAWHPGGKQRSVEAHPYHFATDWTQFPGGSTFIRVPGYMDETFPSFPEAFRVVDDKCGQSRKARRRGWQTIIDARFRTRYSAVEGKNAWHSRDLEVEVIFPRGYRPPPDLEPWIVKAEWRTYLNGEIIATKRVL
jgi:hypothetical protein